MRRRPRGPQSSRYWLNLLAVGGVGFLLLGYVGYIAFWVAGLSGPAQRPVCCITPADLGLDYEDVNLITGDGLALSGWLIPSQNGAAVILLHGYGANRADPILFRQSVVGVAPGRLPTCAARPLLRKEPPDWNPVALCAVRVIR